MTLPWVVHSLSPLRLCPSKVAPTAGPSKPSCHAQVWHSSDHSPMRVTSEMAAYTASGDAAMSLLISILSAMPGSPPHAAGRVLHRPEPVPPCRTASNTYDH